jgi:hypothetical protein
LTAPPAEIVTRNRKAETWGLGDRMALAVQNKILIKTYDESEFPFYEIFSDFCRDAFGCEDVEKLHEFIPTPGELVRVGGDQNTFGHKALYKIDPRFRPTEVTLACETTDRGFISTYRKFISLQETEIFRERLVYQTLPTIRIHLPGNLSVGEYHRDRNYNHATEEVNVWVPVTRAFGTATIHIESEYGRGDHQPVEVARGQFVIFDSLLEHGNEVNREGYTRVSFDFRIIPLHKYRESDKTSVNENRRFRIGDYYSLL